MKSVDNIMKRVETVMPAKTEDACHRPRTDAGSAIGNVGNATHCRLGGGVVFVTAAPCPRLYLGSQVAWISFPPKEGEELPVSTRLVQAQTLSPPGTETG